MAKFKFFRNPTADSIGNNIVEFLQILGQPACIELEGKDRSRTRALVTLLHGNEPSGLEAIFEWIKSRETPAVNIVCIIASVEAALTELVFSYRVLPGKRDLNR